MSKSTKKGNALDNASPEELKRIEECLKQPEFIKLLEDYAKEISDPSTKQAQDLYISQLEQEVLSGEAKDSGTAREDAEYFRQMLKENNQELMKPSPWFCFKTKKADSGDKVFINVCTSKLIEPAAKTNKPPSATPAAEIRTGNLLGGKGDNWRVPYALSPARDCKDHAGAKCVLYDFTVGDATKTQSQTISRMRDLLVQTAMEAISEQAGLKIDQHDFVVMNNLTHKGGDIPAYPIRMTNSALPTPNQQTNPAKPATNTNNAPNAKPKASATSPPPSSSTPAPSKPEGVPTKPLIEPISAPSSSSSSSSSSSAAGASSAPVVATPVYRVVESGEMDGQFGFERDDFIGIRRPKELIVKIELPQLSSIADVDLEMSQRKLVLRHPSYFLELPLAYPVNEDKAAAQFKKAQHLLTVTLPVLPLSKEELAALQSQKKEIEAARSHHKLADPSADGQQAVVEIEPEDAPFDYQDRLDRVVVAVRVPSIDASSVDANFTANSCELQFKAAGKRYQLQLGPLFDCIVPEKCTFAVSVDNLIIKLFKANEGLWVCLANPNASKPTPSTPAPEPTPSDSVSRPATTFPPADINRPPPVPPSPESFEKLTSAAEQKTSDPSTAPATTVAASTAPSAATVSSPTAPSTSSPMVAVPLPAFLNQRSVKSLGVDPSVAFRSKTSSVSATADTLPPILYASSFLFQID